MVVGTVHSDRTV